MSTSSMKGKAQTVLGPVNPNRLGITHTHEHILIDFQRFFHEPEEASEKALARAPITLENLGWIRYNWTSNIDNMEMLNEETAIEEVSFYVRSGGATIVDATSIGIGRDPLALTRIARATGLNIVMGSSYYVGDTHPEDMDDKTVDDIANEIERDLMIGVGNTNVKAGIIGEVGCSIPWSDNERKVMEASGMAQRATGAPLLIHPGRQESAPLEIITFLDKLGADISNTIMSHIDRTIFNWEALEALAESGCYLEFDLFGLETSYYPFGPSVYLPNDVQRMDHIQNLFGNGFGDQVLIAHDVCSKHRLVRYGGHGYAHILRNIVPRMRGRGFTEEFINALLVDNPKRVLTFK